MKHFSIIRKYLVCLLLLISLSLYGIEIKDKSFVGIWFEKVDSGREITTFTSDGTWSAEVNYFDALSGKNETTSINGTWKLIDKTLVKTVTWSEVSELKGMVVSYKIISITKKVIKFNDGNRKGTMIRVENSTQKSKSVPNNK